MFQSITFSLLSYLEILYSLLLIEIFLTSRSIVYTVLSLILIYSQLEITNFETQIHQSIFNSIIKPSYIHLFMTFVPRLFLPYYLDLNLYFR